MQIIFMDTVMAVIETPKGSNQKYAYDTATNFFEFKKCLPAGMVFPFDFGFIPKTKGEDGDPLDIIVVSEFKSFPGCMIECRLVGGIAASQSEEKGSSKMITNDRFIGIPVESTMFKKVKTLADLPEQIMTQLENFFINYNQESRRKFKVEKRLDAKESFKIIEKTK